MQYPPPKVILFDLGGVLVDWDGIEPVMALSRRPLEPEDVRQFWLTSAWVKKFERAQCSPEAFAAGVIAEMDFAATPETFLAQFVSWDRGPLPGAIALLAALRPRFTLACLSNNNALHWQKIHVEMGISHYFDRCYSSHEIGHVKPERAAFDYVIADLAVPAAEVLFLDDNPECVAGGERAGLHAHLARAVPGVKEVLARLGLWKQPGD